MVLLQKTLPIEQVNHYAYTHHGEEHTDSCLLQFSKDMFDGCDRVIQNHSRTSPAHHFAHSFFHLRAITMDGTFLASRLVLTKLAVFQPCCSIL